VANWTYRNTGDPWTTPGAGTGSRDSTILAQIDDPTTDTEYVLEIDPVVVQGWVDDPDSNHGFAIVGLGSIGPYGWLMSSEAPSSQRPMLTVSYYE
jgi:hypothetical protein